MVATSQAALPTNPSATICPNCYFNGNTTATSHAIPSNFNGIGGGQSIALQPNTTYFWRVQGFAATGNTVTQQGSYSAIGQFTTASTTSPLQFTSITPNSVTSPTAPHTPTLTLNGANFINVNRVSFVWSGTTSGSVVWERGDDRWNTQVSNITTTSMTITPTVIASADPAGVTNWTVALRDTSNAIVSRPFTVTYSPGALATQTQLISITPAISQPGGLVTLSARVTATAGAPTGTVRFASSTGNPNCSVALSNGNASCTLAFPSAGTYVMTASYLGAGGLAASVSTSQTHTVSNAVSNLPPALTYAPVPNTIVSIAGSEAQIVVTPSGGSGSGPNAASTLGQCVVGGTGFSINAPASSSSLSFVAGQIAAQAIRLSCTRGNIARTATLTCTQNRPTIGSATLDWQVLCPAITADTPPTLTYIPPTFSPLTFTPAIPRIGDKAQASIRVAPSGGTGTGPGNITIVDSCVFTGVDRSRFRVNSPRTLFLNSASVPQSLNIECDVKAAASSTTTLTCQEGNGAQTARTWMGLICPAGDPMTDPITSTPQAGTPIVFSRASSSIIEDQILSVYSNGVTAMNCSTSAGFHVEQNLSLTPQAFRNVRVRALAGTTANGTLTCSLGIGSLSIGSITWPLQFGNRPPVEFMLLAGGEERLIGVAAGASPIKIRVNGDQTAIPTGTLSDVVGGTTLSSLGSLGSFTRVVDQTGVAGFEASYTPPTRHRGAIAARIRVNVALQSGTVSRELDVYAPPALLIHGLWADAESFSAMKSAFQNAQGLNFYPAPPGGVVAVNYDNWKVWEDTTVRSQIINQRINAQNQMRAGGIWADRFVLIGHSMGGLVSADMARLNPSRYLARLTINTPRQGTHLATLLRDKQNTLLPCSGISSLPDTILAAFGILCQDGLAISLKDLMLAPRVAFQQPKRIDSAVGGLIPASQEIKCLDGTGPCTIGASAGSLWAADAIEGRLPNDPPHSTAMWTQDPLLRRIVRLVDDAEQIPAQERYCRLLPGLIDERYCISRAIRGSRADAYEANHDGLVASASQSFQAPRTKIVSNLPHLGAAGDTRVIALARCWLREGSLSACPDAPSAQDRNSDSGLLTEFLALPFDSMTRIPSGPINASRSFSSSNVDLQAPSGCVPTKIYTLIDGNLSVDSEPPFISTLPSGSLDRINGRVVGLCSGNQYFDTDLTVEIARPVISSLILVPSQLTLMAGSGDSVKVEGTVNGTVYDFTRYANFSTGDSLIARIDPNGAVKTDRGGHTSISAGLHGLTASGTISVIQTEADEITRAGFESGEISMSLGRVLIGGTASGLSGDSGVILSLNGGQALSINQNGNFQFEGLFSVGEDYSVTVLANPLGRTCAVSNGTGALTDAGVSNIQVSCTSTAILFTIGGFISGNGGSAVGLRLVLNSQAQPVVNFATSSFNFVDQIAPGTPWRVEVSASPSGLLCNASNNTGTLATANVSNVVVNCQPASSSFSIGGSISGLGSGLSVVLRNATTGENLSRNANGTYAFTMAQTTGATYAVTVQTQPTGQTCTVSNGSGTVGSSNVTNVSVSCSSVVSTVTVNAIDDTFVGNVFLLGPNGSENFLRVSGWGDTYRTYIRFDVSSLPAAAQIQKAEIELTPVTTYANESNNQIARITGNWTGATLTWASQPTVTEQRAAPPRPATSGSVYRIDITDWVRAWKSGTPNLGVMITPTTTQSESGAAFASMEHPTVVKPRLVVTVQ
ncbi:MAG: DNRLRE domain-containing protein [Xanthomonadales bacterium]|nr:DNRLRE domain-containing protein [Xanthomonadales bacterium]